MNTLYAILSILAVSCLSLIGIVFFLAPEGKMRHWLLALVSLSTGAIFGDVFLHILPELQEVETDFSVAMRILLGGIIFSFVVEKFIRWRHCHVLPEAHCSDESDEHHHHHHHVGTMALIGETIHNGIDGMAIAAAFLVSTPVGVSTTLAIVLHEIPHEIGNFAVLLHSGYSRVRALMYNAMSALSGIAGAGLVFAISQFSTTAEQWLLPFAAGNLLYIAGSDLIPELHRQTGLRESLWQLLFLALGIGSMAALVFLE